MKDYDHVHVKTGWYEQCAWESVVCVGISWCEQNQCLESVDVNRVSVGISWCEQNQSWNQLV